MEAAKKLKWVKKPKRSSQTQIISKNKKIRNPNGLTTTKKRRLSRKNWTKRSKLWLNQTKSIFSDLCFDKTISTIDSSTKRCQIIWKVRTASVKSKISIYSRNFWRSQNQLVIANKLQARKVLICSSICLINALCAPGIPAKFS